MSNEYLRNLPVSFYSQRQNNYQWYKRYTKDEAALLGNPELENTIKPNEKRGRRDDNQRI